MAEELLDQIRDVVEGQIDFDGQRRSEGIATLILALSGLIAFNVGYTYSDITKAVYIGLGGTIFAFIATVPPWSFFNSQPVKWLPAGTAFESA